MPSEPKQPQKHKTITELPHVAGQIDVVFLALITHLKMTHDPTAFESALRATVQLWRDMVVMSTVGDEYLRALDEQLESFLRFLRG